MAGVGPAGFRRSRYQSERFTTCKTLKKREKRRVVTTGAVKHKTRVVLVRGDAHKELGNCHDQKRLGLRHDRHQRRTGQRSDWIESR